MSIGKPTIEHAISCFEKHNGFRTTDYAPYGVKRTSDAPHRDNFIAAEVFCDRIENWLSACDSDDLEKELLELLKQFNYYTEQRFVDGFYDLISEICVNENVDISDILFILPASSKHCKSGGDEVGSAIVQAFRGSIDNEQIRYYASGNLSIDDSIPCVVFVDDILGSGRTMYGLVREFFMHNPWIVNKRICIACLCGRKGKIQKKVKELHKTFGLVTTPYILDEYHKCYGDRINERIREFEERINADVNMLESDHEKKCSMGFENNQLLVSFYYNTPNNTLSCFWRQTKITPAPLFLRRAKRPRVSELKEIGSLSSRNAYLYKSYGIGSTV